MAEKKKMSVAEMLAAARKVDGGGGSAAEPAPAEAAAAGESPTRPAAATPAAPAGAPQPIPKPGAAGRPSVAEMMAAARAKDAAGAAKPAEAAPAAKAAPAPKPKPAAAEKPAAAAAAAPQRDSASVLAAGHKKDKPGPMTKAEAAAKGVAPVAPAAKIIAPPMPPKPAYAMPKPAPAPKKDDADEERRSFLGIGFWLLGAVSALWTLATVKFMFPNVLREPPSKFKVGFPDAFPPGQVEEKFKAQFGIWIVNTEYNGKQEIVALKSVCTHLGCTPNWLEAEQKFKCPCHGSGFYKDGINFEGPAPRPLERYAIRVADDGQLEVDKSRLFLEEKGEWADASSFVLV